MSEPADPQSPLPVQSVTPPEESGPDWTDQVADLVVDTVDTVRQKTTGPILQGARVVVYGVVAVIVAVMVGTLAIILGGRLLEYLPGPIWVAYGVLGAIFVIAGLILWSRRPRGATA
jgi:hypothetical protein